MSGKRVTKLEDYQALATIGSGSFGVCKKVRRKSDGKVYVWKEISYGDMSEKEKQLLVQEVNLLRELRHPHIVRYHDRIVCKEESTLYIIMEFCAAGDLATLIQKTRQQSSWLDERFIWRVFYQLLLALHECHRCRRGVHKVLHRDLKPANVFLDGCGQVKLGDFGLARVLHHNFSLAQTFVGTPYYMAPEQLEGDCYDDKCDVWSLGCLVYELCTLTPPFIATNEKLLAARIRAGRVKPIPSHYSTHLQTSITSLLHTRAVQRPDIAVALKRVESIMLLWQQDAAMPVQLCEAPAGAGLCEASLERLAAELSQRELSVREKELELARREKTLAAKEKSLLEKERFFLKKSSEAALHKYRLSPPNYY